MVQDNEYEFYTKNFRDYDTEEEIKVQDINHFINNINNDGGLKGLLYEIIKSKYFQIEMLYDVLKECHLCDFDKERD